MTAGQMESPSSFEPIYPEWSVDWEIRKMEKKENRKRQRREVLKLMKEHNQEPLPICLNCQKACIQRKVVGLISFKCFVREKP